MKILIELLKLTPTIVEAMKTAETLIPFSGQGQAKLDFVVGVIADVVEDIEAIIVPLTKLIARLTKLFNSTGIWRTSTNG